MSLPCLHKGISRSAAEELLVAAKEDGHYLVRTSETVPNAYTLCLLWVSDCLLWVWLWLCLLWVYCLLWVSDCILSIVCHRTARIWLSFMSNDHIFCEYTIVFCEYMIVSSVSIWLCLLWVYKCAFCEDMIVFCEYIAYCEFTIMSFVSIQFCLLWVRVCFLRVYCLLWVNDYLACWKLKQECLV